ncbi:MAG: gliding motility-associated ABC transporter permease subunit GldF [Flammeovirgaceae bacterium]|nr:gliding motility-associated ABC transporter permease subunit GldF [Flammeovirgaceae bacterium]MBR09077.1 gliding motility-associated ABC transporter permease subunit GldF [Rickettsiales bacterium]HCX20683.1 gliding motility-associated ABC transporter permease subunit GldF [Cytophagales bacterium]|tara:strand:- start:390 stop:1115 length:726 start_codon:yes stop_codon:yes gene_type:complete
MISIFIKEVNEFLNSLIAYVVIGVFLIGIGLLMWVFPDTNILDYGYASLEPLFSFGPYVFMFLIPAITMKSFAEERRTGTIELLQTLPFRDSQIILGKFFAGFFLVLFSVIPTLVYYFSVSSLGNPVGNLDTPGIIGSYIGLVLLGGVFTSIGILSSALTGNQIVSFILAAFLSFFFYTGVDSIASIDVWSDWSYYISEFGIMAHYSSISRGLLDLVDIVYFVSLIAIMLLLTQLIIGSRK